MRQTHLPDPHDHANARRRAEHLRRAAADDFWRDADAAWKRVGLGTRARLARTLQRLRAAGLRLHRSRATTGLPA